MCRRLLIADSDKSSQHTEPRAMALPSFILLPPAGPPCARPGCRYTPHRAHPRLPARRPLDVAPPPAQSRPGSLVYTCEYLPMPHSSSSQRRTSGLEAGLDEGGMGSVVRWARNGLKAEARTEEPFTVVAGHDPWEQSMERRLYEGRRRPPRRIPLKFPPHFSLPLAVWRLLLLDSRDRFHARC